VKVASRSKDTRETPATETVSQALDLLEAFLSHGSALDLAELAAILKVDREQSNACGRRSRLAPIFSD
jgi:hypothetical protein